MVEIWCVNGKYTCSWFQLNEETLSHILLERERCTGASFLDKPLCPKSKSMHRESVWNVGSDSGCMSADSHSEYKQQNSLVNNWTLFDISQTRMCMFCFFLSELRMEWLLVLGLCGAFLGGVSAQRQQGESTSLFPTLSNNTRSTSESL